ncbi:hypothetical protein ES707_16063 [subsurface metagenome]
MFSKSKIKLVVDVLMFLCMAVLGGLGFLMKYVLLSGQEAQVAYGAKVEVYFLGLDKHEWGAIHLIIAFVLLGLLLLHIILNWKPIVSMYQRLIGGQRVRKIVTAVFIIVSALLIAFPFVVNPQVQEKVGGGGGHGVLRDTAETINLPDDFYRIAPNIESLFVANGIGTSQ